MKPWPDHLPDKYWWAKELARALVEKPRRSLSDTASTISEQPSTASGHTVHWRQQRISESDATTQSSATTQSHVQPSIVDVESLQSPDSEGNNTGGQSQSDMSSHSSRGRDPGPPGERKLNASFTMKRWQTEDSIHKGPDYAPAPQTLQADPRELPYTPARGVAEWLGGQRTLEWRTDCEGQRNTPTQIPAEHSTPKVVLERVKSYTPRRGTRDRRETTRFGEQAEEEQLEEIDDIPESATRRVTWSPGKPMLYYY